MKIREEYKEAIKELKEAMISNPKWIKDWSLGLRNFISKSSYSGINILLLSRLMKVRGHKQPYFITFNQAKEKGWKVKKGSKAYPIFFYKPYEIEKEVEVIDEETGETKTEIKKVTIPLLKKYNVFNIEDIEGDFELPNNEENIEPDLENLLNNIHAYIPIEYGNPAYYPARHIITMPKINDFESKEAYFAAIFHELTHSTMNFIDRSKLNRAEEELVAELGSVLLCKHFGIDYPIERHAGYIVSWGKDVNEKQFYSVLKHTFKAVEFLIQKLTDNQNQNNQAA